jgi:hypothetical protein
MAETSKERKAETEKNNLNRSHGNDVATGVKSPNKHK